jgi:transcriptional activator of cad operon
MDCPAGESIRIGSWRVDPALNEISRDGRTVRLEARAMGLLLRLAQRPGEVVSVDDLITDVWAGVVVTTDSVYQAVALLRRELGDDARQPAYIATIPRLGYRMVANVCPWTEEDAPSLMPIAADDAQTRDTPATTSKRANRSLIYVALAGLLAIGAVLLWNYRPSQAAPAVVVLPFLDLTTQAMDEEYFADGLAEEVATRLSHLPGVRVAAPTSSYALQSKQLTAREIGQTLGVAYVIDGSIRRSDARLRVSMRLTRTEDGYVVWSDTYEKPIVDKLATQDEVAERAVAAMQSVLGAGTGNRDNSVD